MKLEKKYPGLCREFTAAGTPRWRVRVERETTRKIGLPAGMDDRHPEFDEAYAAARVGEEHRLNSKAKAEPRRGTLDDLRLKYDAAMAIMVQCGDLDEKTRSSRSRALRQACDVKKGARRIGEMNAELPVEAFTKIMDSYKVRTGAAQATLKALKAAYLWGSTRGFPKASPVSALSSSHRSKGGATAWTDADEAKFLAWHARGSKARLWFWLAKNMAGRIGDTCDIGPSNILLKNGRAYLGWQPKKRGSTYVEVPLMLELADELQLHDLHPDAFLVTEFGRPFASSGSLDNSVRTWIVAAGLTKTIETKAGETEIKAARSQHGVRKRVAHELAENGATVYEIAARLSHSDFKSAAPYVAGVNRARLAESGFDRVERARGIPCVPRPAEHGTPRGTPYEKIAAIAATCAGVWHPQGESNPCLHRERVMS